MDNNVSFKSKINFVSYDKFQRTVRPSIHYIPYGNDAPLYIKASNFFTESVRTCTAGGITDTISNALGFHIIDSLENEIKINNIGNTLSNIIRGDNIRGLLVGSKDYALNPHSKNIFNSLKEILMQKIPKISFFQEHQMVQSETFVHYDVKNDTWTLCTRYKQPNANAYFDVLSYEKLKNIFRKIHIADGDELFIDGERII